MGEEIDIGTDVIITTEAVLGEAEFTITEEGFIVGKEGDEYTILVKTEKRKLRRSEFELCEK
jgi:hypothetical protein